jgi:hypothetical protein
MKVFALLTVLTLTSFSVVVACGDDDADGDGDAGAPSAAGRAATAGAPNDGGGHHAGGTGHGGGEHGPGSAECEVIGQLCHPADTRDGGSECHDTGHIGNAADCAEAFAGCIETCVEDSASSSPHCAALTALCAGAAEGSGTAHDCYRVGAAGDAEDCEAELETCAEPCSELFGHGSNMGDGDHGGMGHGGAGSGRAQGGAEHGGAGGSG